MFNFLKKKTELGFSELTTKDNFYQTSSFFPMPIVLVSTLSPEGKTNLGPYSLCFTFHIADRDYYAAGDSLEVHLLGGATALGY